MGPTHDLVIFNGMSLWPSSSIFTCFPHGGGASIVNYLTESPTLAPHITDFHITLLLPDANQTYIVFNILTSQPIPNTTPTYRDIHFDHKLSLDYAAHLSSLL